MSTVPEMMYAEGKPRYQCKLCGKKLDTLPDQCPQCGTTAIRDVEHTDGLYDEEVSDEASPWKKSSGWCWQEPQLPLNQKRQRHKFVEEIIDTVDFEVDPPEYHKVSRCKECGIGATAFDGRHATEKEVALARDGKIAPMPTFWMGGITKRKGSTR